MPDARNRELLDRYHRYRQLLPVIQNRVLEPLPEDVTKELLDDAATRLRLMEDGQILIGERYEMTVIADHAFYDLVRDGKTAIQRHLETAEPPTDPDEAILLQALTKSRWTLLNVLGVDPGFGVAAAGVLDGHTSLIVSPEIAEVYYTEGSQIATRLATLPELTMPVGGTMPIDPAAEHGIYAALDERFPYRRSKGLVDLTPVERADFHQIIANAALDGMDSFRRVTETILSGMKDLVAEAQSGSQPPPSGRLPRGQRPKTQKPKGKHHKRKR